MKYAYPAILTYDPEEKCYYVNFPDIEGCFTDGKTLPEAIEMGEDALALMLCQIEDDGDSIPAPTDVKAIKVAPNETVSLIFADTMEYTERSSLILSELSENHRHAVPSLA